MLNDLERERGNASFLKNKSRRERKKTSLNPSAERFVYKIKACWVKVDKEVNNDKRVVIDFQSVSQIKPDQQHHRQSVPGSAAGPRLVVRSVSRRGERHGRRPVLHPRLR